MRAILEAGLVSALVFQAFIASAQRATLEERLRDLSAEVERFAASVQDVPISAQRRDEEDVELARLRARMRRLPLDADVSVVLRGGERIEGKLADASREEFALWVRGSGGLRFKKDFRYEAVQSSVLPETDGWLPIERIRGIESGKKIEIVLMDETTIKGRLSSVTSEAVFLDQGEAESREAPFDACASVRKSGMAKSTKIAIIAGSVAGGVLLLGVAAVYYGSY